MTGVQLDDLTELEAQHLTELINSDRYIKRSKNLVMVAC